MSSSQNLCQLLYSSLSCEDEDVNEVKRLYPYPFGQLESRDFSLGIISLQSVNSRNSYQIEFRILSPIKFSVESSRYCKPFDEIFSHKNLKIYQKQNNKYELNIKHFLFVLSRIKVLINTLIKVNFLIFVIKTKFDLKIC
jgi:hypothetical protein